MSLIKSISGIRGTIGGVPGESLTPVDIVAFVSAYAQWVSMQSSPKNQPSYRVVVGRDARISGLMVESLVNNTLLAMGVDVISAGLATTPTVEMAVVQSQADGGIILTASHNPANWNALKLLNSSGEFLSASDGEVLLDLAAQKRFQYASVDRLGTLVEKNFLADHIAAILALPEVLVDQIRRRHFRIAIDPINSVGAIAIPELLAALGVSDIMLINGQADGNFAHNPEPLPEHLTEIRRVVIEENADLGIVVDPDVDRLAFISNDGSFFGEEYSLVAVSDYILSKHPGNTVSNLSSSRALKDITEQRGGQHFASAVGEVNVVEMMKEKQAVIGGEGNGGIIYPALHFGRDALVGVALFLSLLVEKNVPATELRALYPDYFLSKNKIQLTDNTDLDRLLEQLKEKYSAERIITLDGLRIDFADAWVHLRKSNTEPIIRIYAEAKDKKQADHLAEKMMQELKSLSV